MKKLIFFSKMRNLFSISPFGSSAIAPILERYTGKIRFAVDDVKPAVDRLPMVSARSQFEKILGSPLLSFSHDDAFETISGQDTHPLASAVHSAFSQHRPLSLTPDIIWLTIAQGFAHHVNNHAEELRSSFVKHQGKEKLLVKIDCLPTEPAQWAEVIEQWTLQLRDHVGADMYRSMECNFSTTTPITKIASHMVMMDVFQQYFDYRVICVCGIPEITLLGTVADWQSIYDRVASLKQYNLDWWVDRLLPICQEFINAAQGKPDRDFWKCIYKPQRVYAAEYMTGWLSDLFPYLRHGVTKSATVRNYSLDLDRCELPRPVEKRGRPIEPSHGINLKSLPLGISQVSFKLMHQGSNHSKSLDLALMAGFIGVRQNSCGTLQPEIGWGVHDATDKFSQLLDRIEQEHLTQPPLDDLYNKPSISISRELIQLLNRFDGATLYGDRECCFHILPVNLWEKDQNISHFMYLGDGRLIAFNPGCTARRCLFLLGNRADDFTSAVVIATSMIELFDRILAADGTYYFDDPGFKLITPNE
jgi:Domain of unknown function (DUF4419)